MTKHLQRKHPDKTLPEHRTVERPEQVTATKKQLSIENAFEWASSDKHKKIMWPVLWVCSLLKICSPFLWSKMWGFNIQFKHSTPRYAVPCHTHFSNFVIPSFCDKTCKATENDLAQTQSTDHGQLDLLGNRELHDCDGPLQYMLDWQMKATQARI